MAASSRELTSFSCGMPADPVELAALYDREGADEIVFLDISASVEGRSTMIETVTRTAGEITIPLTVGGGISQVEDMKRILRAGGRRSPLIRQRC